MTRNPRPHSRRFTVALLGCALLHARSLLAHEPDTMPPRPMSELVAHWPSSAPAPYDVIVPLEITVAADGTVTAVRVEVPVTPALDAAAVAAAYGIRFVPAIVNGVAASARVRAAMRFRADATQPAATETQAASPVPSGRAYQAPNQSPASAHEHQAPNQSPASAHEHQHQHQHAHDGSSSAEAPMHVVVEDERASARSAAATGIERRVIEAAPHRTAADLMQLVPGIAISQHSGEGKAYQIFYRGFDAVHGQDLEIWAGGAPVNDVSNIHGQGYADLNFLMPEVVRRIQAEPGPYGPSQGDFAVAGSLRFDLGYAEPGVTAKATVGSFGTRRYFLAWRPKAASESTFAAFETYASDGFGPARAARRTSALAQATFDLGAGTALRILATGYSTRFESAGVLRLEDLETGKVDRFDSYDPKQGGNATRESLVLDLRRSGSDWNWSLAPYFVLRTLRLRQNFTGFVPQAAADDAPGGEASSEQQSNDAFTFGMVASYRKALHLLSKRDAVETGLSMRADWIDQSQRQRSVLTDQVVGTAVDARVRASDLGAWLDFDLHPLDRLQLRLGARLDGLAYTVEDHGVGAAGETRSSQGAHLGKKGTVTYQLGHGATAVASYGEGFRSPQARSLTDGQTAPFTEVRAYEAGVRYADRRTRASLSAFRTLLSDDLTFDHVTARNETTPATRRSGVTAEFSAEPASWLVSNASFTYTRAEFRAGNSRYDAGSLVPYAPQLVGRTDLATTFAVGQLLDRTLTGRAGVANTYLGRRPLPYGEFGHDIFLVDARASVRRDLLELGLEVFNVLDADWYDGEFVYTSSFTQSSAPSLVPERHVTVGSPRTVWLTLALHL